MAIFLGVYWNWPEFGSPSERSDARQARRAFTFANGSTYTGEWLGADLFLVKQHEENVTCLPEIPDTDTEM